MFVEDDSLSLDNRLNTLDPEWQPILHASNQVVLYNPTSHALAVQLRSPATPITGLIRRRNLQEPGRCPYCHRSIHALGSDEDGNQEDLDDLSDDDSDDSTRSRVPNYFQLLQISNETTSIPSTPAASTPRGRETPISEEPSDVDSTPFKPTNMAEGYFEAFFQEECRLGMGANGSVYLCRVRV